MENKVVENNIYDTNVIHENKVKNENVIYENSVQNNIAENKVNSNQVIENRVNDNATNENHNNNLDIFSDSKAEITDANNFVYTDSNKNYIEIEVNVSNINFGNNSKYNVKYYLAGSPNESISDDKYVEINKIDKQSNGMYLAKFKINSKDLSNLDEIVNSDNLYLYMKAENGVNVSKKVLLLNNVSKIKNYINNKKVDEINKDNLNKYKDNTVYNRILPQTGALPWFVLSFAIVTMIGIVSYFKFKNINK